METCSHLLEIRKFMNKYLVCDIQVAHITLSATGLDVHTNKWLHLEDWLEIDGAIHKLLEPFSQSETLDGFEEKNFHLGGAIRIECKKSKVTRSHKRILGEDREYLPIALDIFVTKINTSALMEQITEFEEQLSQINKNCMMSPTSEAKKEEVDKESLREYDPTSHTAVSDPNSSTEYVPSYTASAKTPTTFLDTSGSAISEPYSPKPIAIDTSSPDQISDSPTPQVPDYKPAKIAQAKSKSKSKEKETTEKNNNNNDGLKLSRRRHSPEHKLRSKSKELQSRTNITKRTVLQPNSITSNSKPTRNAELFGSDDSDQEMKSPKKTTSRSQQNSNHTATPLPNSLNNNNEREAKRKRIRLQHDSLSSTPGKNSIEGWLSKGSLKSSDKDKPSNGKSSSKTSSKSSRHESTKKHHLPKDDQQRSEREAQQIKELAELRDALKANRSSPPPDMEILSLTHLSLDYILNTFNGIRHVLDPIFKTYSKKSKVTGHDGINHMKTLMLIEDKKQLQMLNFLRSNYQPEEKGVPTLTDLYINAMVPEWTINVFMKEFNFTRTQALQRLQAQEELTVRKNRIEENLDTSGGCPTI